MKACPKCEGTGERIYRTPKGGQPDLGRFLDDCRACGGTGHDEDRKRKVPA